MDTSGAAAVVIGDKRVAAGVDVDDDDVVEDIAGWADGVADTGGELNGDIGTNGDNGVREDSLAAVDGVTNAGSDVDGGARCDCDGGGDANRLLIRGCRESTVEPIYDSDDIVDGAGVAADVEDGGDDVDSADCGVLLVLLEAGLDAGMSNILFLSLSMAAVSELDFLDEAVDANRRTKADSPKQNRYAHNSSISDCKYADASTVLLVLVADEE